MHVIYGAQFLFSCRHNVWCDQSLQADPPGRPGCSRIDSLSGSVQDFFFLQKHNQFTNAAKPELSCGQNQPGRNVSLHRLPAAFIRHSGIIKRLTAVHMLTFATSTDHHTKQANLQILSQLSYLTSALITFCFIFSTKPKNLFLYQP